jgi:hypothetical protein
MKPFIQGTVGIKFFDSVTGELIDEQKPESNMVLDVGIRELWRRATLADATGVYRLNNIHLGDDIGTGSQWSIFNPQPAQRGFVGEDQNTTFIVDADFTFPTDEELLVTVTLNGTNVMNDNFPTAVEYRFSSMTLRYANGIPFSFKRFPMRSLSRFVNVQIDWRFKFLNASEFCEGVIV